MTRPDLFPVGEPGFALDLDADRRDDRKARRWLAGALLFAIGAGLIGWWWTANPREPRPDLQLRGTLDPEPSWLAGPIRPERELAILEPTAGGRP